MREIEKIEKDQMRNIFQVKSGIQVPIHLMYLELGQVPARFQIQRFKLNFLQYMLQQKTNIFAASNAYCTKAKPSKGGLGLRSVHTSHGLEVHLV